MTNKLRDNKFSRNDQPRYLPNWLRVSKKFPCPRRGKLDWCSISADGTCVICMRVSEGCIKVTRNDGYLHRLKDSCPNRAKTIVVKSWICVPDTKRSDECFNRKRTHSIGNRKRVNYTTERPTHVAKNRLNLPDKLPLDSDSYKSFFTHFKERITNG